MTFLDYRLMRVVLRLIRPLMPGLSAGLGEDVSNVLARSQVSRLRLRLMLLHASAFWLVAATGTLLVTLVVGMSGKLAAGTGVVAGWVVDVVKGLGIVVVWCMVEAVLLSSRERLVGIAGTVRNIRVSDAAVVARWRPWALDWCVPTAVVAAFVALAHWY